MGWGFLVLVMILVMILYLNFLVLLGMEGGDCGVEVRDSFLDIFMFGNSYILINLLVVRLDSILMDLGEDVVVMLLISGGLKLSEHVERVDIFGYLWNVSL